MWDQYDIGFGNNKASLQASVPISILIGVQHSIQVGVIFSFPAKVLIKVKLEEPTSLPVKTVKLASRYPQSERSATSSAAKWAASYVVGAAKKHFEKKGASFLHKAYKVYEKAQNVADVMSLVTDIFERMEEGKKAKNKIKGPEFNGTDAARGVHPQDVLRQASANTDGLVPAAVTGEALDTILENVRRVEAQNFELTDRLTELEDARKRRDMTATPKRGDSGKAPVCRTCKNKAAGRRQPTEAGFKKFADEIKACSNAAFRLAGETAPARKRQAEELEDEPYSSNADTEQEEQSTRQKRRRVKNADAKRQIRSRPTEAGAQR
ncbi:hypothetical protein DL764_008114 [Monosporascus ibericus]|uniref:Uncharacterized protein n=1 Tax=Monosporascus ibericus TaxID=155417 RepID=A0A4Q4SYB8_9PEZI|nr:hypothetical protein DL764_008114 [Monosporascus ibericus]